LNPFSGAIEHDSAIELPFSTGAHLNHGFKTAGAKFGNSIGWQRRASG
jgi:hypothetical protein